MTLGLFKHVMCDCVKGILLVTNVVVLLGPINLFVFLALWYFRPHFHVFRLTCFHTSLVVFGTLFTRYYNRVRIPDVET